MLTPSPDIKKVHAALSERCKEETLRKIARNAGLPYGWMQQFLYENINDPGYSRLKKLAEYLGVKLNSKSTA